MFYNDNGIPRELKVKVSSNCYIAEYNSTPFSAITAANQGGKAVVCIYNGNQYELSIINSSLCYLNSISGETQKRIKVTNENVWSLETITLQTELLCNTTYNKTTNKVATMADVPKITYGTDEPTGGENGDIYIKLKS